MKPIASKLLRSAGPLLALLAFATPAAPQSGDAPLAQPRSSAILIIDQEALFASSLFGRRVQAEAEEAARLLGEENLVIQQALEAEEEALTEQRKEMDPEAFRALADVFDQKVQETRAAQDRKSREIARNLDLQRQLFLQRALPALSDIVRERNAVAILEIGTVFLSAESIDITREAVARINADIGDGAAAPTGEQAPEPRPATPGAGEAARPSEGTEAAAPDGGSGTAEPAPESEAPAGE